MTELNDAATLAANMTKPNKKEAHAVVCDLIEAGRLTGVQGAVLYSFFMPALPSRPKTAGDWVLKAKAKRDVRAYLNYAYSDGKYLTATDGHHIHRAPVDHLPEGFYDTTLTRVDLDARFPDVDRLIHVDPDLRPRPVPAELLVEIEPAGLTCYRLPNGALVQKRYWDEACSGLGPDATVYLPSDYHAAIRLDGMGGRIAVIAPVRQ